MPVVRVRHGVMLTSLSVVALLTVAFVSRRRSERASTRHDIVTEALSRRETIKLASISPTAEKGDYLIWTDVLVADQQTTKEKPEFSLVTLATQGSANRIDNIPRIAQRWAGPVSVAIFATGNVTSVMYALASLRRCYRHVRQWVTAHIVMVAGLSYAIPQATLLAQQRVLEAHTLAECPAELVRDTLAWNPKVALQFELLGHASNYADGSTVEYPNNMLRNVARSAVQTPYTFVMDIDMVPSRSLAQQFGRALDENGHSLPRIAFVVPAFEVDTEGRAGGDRLLADATDDKESLLKYYSAGHVRVFYEEACLKCQRPTHYVRWLTHGGHPATYRVNGWKDPWEPFFITLSSAPLYDERFRQYGFNRISQVCEMWLAGFDFEVLSLGFVAHAGFKRVEQGGFHDEKDAENDRNRERYREFKRELKERYGTARRC